MERHDGSLTGRLGSVNISLSNRLRTFGGVVLAVVVAGCAAGPTSSASSPSPTATVAATPTPSAGATALVVNATAQHNALVSDLGKPGAPVLDDAAKAVVARVASAAQPKQRAQLRYALAADSSGKVHLVVYDGLGLPPNGKEPGKKFSYIVFKPLNAADGSTYDPEQNAIDEPVPPPPEREATTDGIKN